jgi:hypothetical protein
MAVNEGCLLHDDRGRWAWKDLRAFDNRANLRGCDRSKSIEEVAEAGFF